MNNPILLKVSDFSKSPGPRYKYLGPNSGEEYRDSVLLPAFNSARESKTKLIVNLDLSGDDGYGSSFLDESFGELVRRFTLDEVNQTLMFQAPNEPWWIDEVRFIMNDASKQIS
ncbi:MAG: STAS-like domain-containing protein [Candidatus Kapabacteria bacterium]|nr:STAS-like domain-containing protein [Candidatus Kapabacteria bacterium]